MKLTLWMITLVVIRFVSTILAGFGNTVNQLRFTA